MLQTGRQARATRLPPSMPRRARSRSHTRSEAGAAPPPVLCPTCQCIPDAETKPKVDGTATSTDIVSEHVHRAEMHDVLRQRMVPAQADHRRMAPIAIRGGGGASRARGSEGAGANRKRAGAGGRNRRWAAMLTSRTANAAYHCVRVKKRGHAGKGSNCAPPMRFQSTCSCVVR